LKEAREVAVVTLVGRLFHARAAVKRSEQEKSWQVRTANKQRCYSYTSSCQILNFKRCCLCYNYHSG